MALKDQKEYQQAAFETEDETTTTTTAKEETTTTTQSAAASVAATTAIAKAATTPTAVAAPRAKRVIAYADLKDSFDTATVSALSQATPRVTAEQGALKKDRTLVMGSTAKVEVVSWNHRWAIGCGEEKQNDEMKQLFRVSFDNKVIDGEEHITVADYIESLKAMGYAKAKSSPYIDLFAYVLSTEKGGEIAPDDRELTLFQLSKTSAGNFTAFCVSRGLLESRGVVQHSDIIEVLAESKTAGTNSFTNMNFKAAK